MRLWIKIFLTCVITLSLAFSASYIFMSFKGKDLILKQLEDITHKKVTLDYFELTPPFNLDIKNLKIEGLAKVESIFIQPSIPRLFIGMLGFNSIKIVRPEITFEKFAPQALSASITGPAPSLGTEAVVGHAAEANNKRAFRLIFKRLRITDGRINFIDHTVSTGTIKISVKDINLKLTNLYVAPVSAIANFELSGKIPWQEGQDEGKIEFNGWINLHKKDMLAALRVEDIDGIYLYPYYSNWVDLEKARIEKAKLKFTSNIHSLNNNLTAECHLELTDIMRKPRSPEESQQKAEKIANIVLEMLKSLNQGKIALDFTIRTKMDRPEFGFGNVKTALEENLQKARSGTGFKTSDVLMLPAKLLQGAVNSATDLSKAVIDGTFAVGKELKNAVEDSFKKEKK